MKKNKLNRSHTFCFPIHFCSSVLNTYFFLRWSPAFWLKNEKAWMATSISPSSGTSFLFFPFLLRYFQCLAALLDASFDLECSM